MLTVTDILTFLAIQHQRLAAARQRIDALMIGDRIVVSQLDLAKHIDAKLPRLPAYLTKEDGDKVSDIYTRIENLDEDLNEAMKAIYVTSDVRPPIGWRDAHVDIMSKLLVLNHDIDRLCFK